ncbi:DUF3558 family protein [Kutzneria sp. CA-103260]|uniref:DUF3558 family protein n=1 Tax=Kutzneria sp. CA-103260 TaxID=2802641 RepID=UPI001BA7682E|nr:DUF3558 family protein [Kutzneria sp. CA-103260]
MTILSGVAALALAGCNNNPGGTAGPTTGASTTTATSSADTVSNPLDTTKLQQNLCGGLTPAQLAPYMGQVRTTSPVNQSDYAGCDLLPADSGMATVSINVYPNLGPSAMIASNGNFPYAKNIAPIEGYTARNTGLKNPPNGECSTSAAVSSHATVEVSVQWADKSSQYYNNPCTVSDALTPLLLDNIKASR